MPDTTQSLFILRGYSEQNWRTPESYEEWEADDQTLGDVAILGDRVYGDDFHVCEILIENGMPNEVTDVTAQAYRTLISHYRASMGPLDQYPNYLDANGAHAHEDRSLTAPRSFS